MKPIQYFLFLLLSSVILLSCGESPKEKPKNWISLFNGKDLTGWDIKIAGQEVNDNFQNTFIVEDSMIKVNYAEYDSFRNKFGHLYYKDRFSHYRLRIEYRFVGNQVPGAASWANRNSGVMLHSQSAQEQQLTQNFPISIEMQFLGAVEGQDRTNCNLASPGTHVIYNDSLYTNHMLYSNYPAPAGEDWVSVEAIVYGDSLIHHLVEGDTVLTYTKTQIGGWEAANQNGWLEDKTWVTENVGKPLKAGHFALQAEGHAIHFRKVELLDLSGEYR